MADQSVLFNFIADPASVLEAIEAIESALLDLRAAFDEVAVAGASLDDIAAAVSAADEAIGGAIAEADGLAGSLDDVAAAGDNAAASMDAVGASSADAGAGTAAMGAGASDSAAEMEGLTAGTLAADTAMKGANETSGFGAFRFAMLGLGIAATGYKFTQMGMQAQSALTIVGALTGASMQDMQMYTEKLQQMSEELGVPLASAAEGLYYVVSAGYRGADALTVLADAQEAATAGGAQLKWVANGITSAMNAYGASAKDAGYYSDIMITAVTEGKQTFEQFAKAIGKGAVYGRVAHETFAEVAAGEATLTRFGLSAAVATTDLDSLTRNVLFTTVKAATAAKKLGISFDEQAFSSMNLIQRLQYLQYVSNGNTYAFQKMAGGALPLLAGQILLANGAKAYTEILGAMNGAQGATANAFKMTTETMMFHLQHFESVVSVFAYNLAMIAGPLIVKVFDTMAGVVQSLSDFMTDHLQVAIPILGTIATVLGTLVLASAKALILPLIKLDEIAFGFIFKFTSLIGILISLATAFAWAYNNVTPFKNIVDTVTHAIGGLVGAIGGAISSLFSQLGQSIGNAVSHLTDFFNGVKRVKAPIQDTVQVLDHMHHSVDDVVKKTQNAGNIIVRVATPFDRVAGAVRNFASAMKQLQNFFTPVIAHTEKVTQSMTGFGDGSITAGEKVGRLAQNMHGTKTSLVHVQASVSQFQQSFESFAKSIVQHGNEIKTIMLIIGGQSVVFYTYQSILPVIGFLLTDIARAAGLARIGLAMVFSGGFATAMSSVAGLLSAVGVAFSEVILPILAIAAVIFSVIVAFKTLWDNVAPFRQLIMNLLGVFKMLGDILMTQLRASLSQVWSTIQTQLMPALRLLWTQIQPLMPVFIALGAVIIGVVIGAIIGLTEAISAVIVIVSAVIQGLVVIIGGVVQVISGVIGAIVGIVMFFVHFFAGAFNIIRDALSGNTKQLYQDVIGTWRQLKADLGNIVHSLITAVIGIWNATIGGLFVAVKAFVTGIIDMFKHLFDTLVGHSIIPDMINAIVKWFLSLPGKIIQLIANFVVSVATHIFDLEMKVLSIFGRLKDKAIQVFGNMFSAIVAGVANLPKMMGDKLQQAGQAFLNKAKDLAGGLKKLLGFGSPTEEGPLATADRWIPNLINMMSSGLTTGQVKLTTAAKTLATTLGKSITDAITTSATASSAHAVDSGRRLVEGVASGILQNQQHLNNTAKQLVTGMHQAIGQSAQVQLDARQIQQTTNPQQTLSQAGTSVAPNALQGVSLQTQLSQLVAALHQSQAAPPLGSNPIRESSSSITQNFGGMTFNGMQDPYSLFQLLTQLAGIAQENALRGSINGL